jgi:hypothetical protein
VVEALPSGCRVRGAGCRLRGNLRRFAS